MVNHNVLSFTHTELYDTLGALAMASGKSKDIETHHSAFTANIQERVYMFDHMMMIVMP